MAYLKGRGTSTEPYIINSVAGLISMFTDDIAKGAYFALACDVIMSESDRIIYTTQKSINFSIDCLGHNLVLKVKASGAGTSSAFSISSFAKFNNGNIVIDVANGYSWQSGSNNAVYFTDCIITFINSYAQLPKVSMTRGITYSGLTPTGTTNAFSIGVSPSGYTRLDALANPYNPALFTSFNRAVWVVDGNSYPRLIPRTTPYITQFWAVKGTVKVGGVPAKRRVTAHHPVDFKLITETESSDVDGKYSIDCGGYTDFVYVIHSEKYGDLFTAGKTYAVGDVIHPPIPNGYRYVCTVGGVSNSVAPSAWPTVGQLISGAATFDAKPVYQPFANLVAPVLYDSVTGLPV